MDSYDLAVIGGGTAGLVAAAGGASMGARVVLVERERLGGDCLHYGCVPTKALVKSAKVAALTRRAGEFGASDGEGEVDFDAVMERMRRIVREAGAHDDPERFRRLGVSVRLGQQARFESPRIVSVDGASLRAKNTIVATGSYATVPAIEGLRQTGYVTHVEALELRQLPRSMVVIGAGPIGCEFAQILARFGCRVTLLGSAPLPLPREDTEIGEALLRFLSADGVSYHGGLRARSARYDSKEKVVSATGTDGATVEARGEEILVAAGRAPATDGLGLDNAGVALVENGIMVDDRLRTSAPNIYAAGDVTGKRLFTHVADYQAKLALRNALFPLSARADYSAVPWTTFTDPEVARVGMTEEQARLERDDVRCYRYHFKDLDRAITEGEAHGLTKIVTDARGKILGCHIIGPEAGNCIAEVSLAMQNGLPLQRLSSAVRVYPTLSEAVGRAADGYYRQKLFSGRGRRFFDAYFGLRRSLSR